MRTVWIFIMLVAAASLQACDACRFNVSDLGVGGGVGLTAGIGDLKYRWSLDTTFEYRNWDRINPSVAFNINQTDHGHTHDTMDEWTAATRISYNVTNDLNIGLSQNYRKLRDSNVEDSLLLGRHSEAVGFGDLELDFKYCFKHQEEGEDGKGAFPADLAIFGSLKPPTGQTHERDREGILYDAHDQPGSGSWDGMLGVAVSKRWGAWGASAAVSYSLKGEGTQEYKAGNVVRLALGSSYKLPFRPAGWKLYAALGLQGLIEDKPRAHGEFDRNHGGQFIYAIPGFSAQPTRRLSLNASVIIPVLQEYNGFHQHQDFGAVFGIGVRF